MPKTMNLSRFRLITFDVTDTLLNFRVAPGKQYGDVAAIYGVHCDPHLLSANFKSHWHRMSQLHPNYGRKTGLDWQSWWRQIVFGTFKDSTSVANDDQLESISAHLIRLYETSLCWQQSYGALGLLSYLRHRQIPLGIISNYDPRLEITLVNTKLRHYFNFVLGSYESGLEKPNPEFFQKAMEVSRVQGLKPKDCLHIGNTVKLDYFGAKSTDWNAVLLHQGDHKDLKIDPGDVFPNLYELHRHFLENSNGENTQVSAQL